MPVAISSNIDIQSVSSEHLATVQGLYVKALENLEFYPEPKKANLLADITREKANFDQAVGLRVAGKIILEIKTEVCKEARSWLKGNVPALIGRYSNYQISESEIKARKSSSKDCIAACTRKYKDAIQTLKELEE